jgi:hypothetical protein
MSMPRTFLSSLTGSFAQPAAENPTVAMVEAAYRHLDGLGTSAEVIGAVNDVVRRGGGELIGENTDGQGSWSHLRMVADPVGQHLVIFGAGGAGRAVAPAGHHGPSRWWLAASLALACALPSGGTRLPRRDLRATARPAARLRADAGRAGPARPGRPS